MAWFGDFVQTKDARPQLGAPPNSCQVYGRFSKGCNILDIGSGNCSKLARYTGTLKITAVDPDLADVGYVLNSIKKPV
ncbi:hypothetical protein KPL84_00400, partial [Bacillus anthracis]|nr:hypothetical protein [Bacillus anthracis]